MSDLTKLTLEAALDGMAKGDFSSEELTKAVSYTHLTLPTIYSV